MAADLVQADFSNATAGVDLLDFTPAVGAKFQRSAVLPGSIVAAGTGAVRAGAAFTDCVYFSPTPAPTADYSVRLLARYPGVTRADVVGPAIRCSAATDTFYTLIWTLFDGATLAGLCLYKHVNGLPSQIGSTFTGLPGAIPLAGASAIVQLSVKGTSLIGYFNGQVALTVPDPDIAGPGYGGMYLRCGSTVDGGGPEVAELYLNPDPDYAPTAPGPVTDSGVGTPPLNVAGMGRLLTRFGY